MWQGACQHYEDQTLLDDTGASPLACDVFFGFRRDRYSNQSQGI